MSSEIDWQGIETAATTLALHQGSDELKQMRQSDDTSIARSNRIKKSSGYDGAIDEKTSFDETRKAEAIKAYLAQKSRNR